EVDRCADLRVAGTGRDQAGEVRVHGAGDVRVAGSAADLEQFIQIVGFERGLVDDAATEHGAHDWFGLHCGDPRTDTGREDAGDDQSGQETRPGDSALVVVRVDRHDALDPLGLIGRGGEGEYGTMRLA